MKGKMKKVVSLLLSIAMIFTSVNILPSTVEAAVNSSSGSSSWSLVWNDEFNQTVGGTPDSSTWSYDTGHGDNGWGNQEVQRYTNSTDNVRIVDMSSDSGSTDGKALAITAKRENGEITSGRIKTLNKQYMKYGRVEARLRLDDGMRSGVWPAFWMMGNDIESGASWPYCGEIDIMEHRNAEKQIISTLHWNTGTGTSANYNHIYAGSETTNQYGNIDSINDWHDYAVEWYEDVMKFYLDGVCFETLNINSSEMEEFQKEHFILLNLAIGSSGSPFTLGQTVSDDFKSATMYVDYVRVYQGKDSAFSIAKSGTSETKPTQTTTGDGFTICSSKKTSLGGWGYYMLSGNAGKYQNGTNLDDEFVLKLTSNNKSNWGVQAFTKNISVTSGHKYNVSVDVNSSAATGDVLMKDEIGHTEFTNQALSAGNNTLTGSFTANSDTMQFMFNLANVDAGTTLKFSNVKVTDVTGSGATEATTPASGDSSWEVIGGGDANTWYYDKNSMSGISSVVNIQKPGFAKEKGIYITVRAGISSVAVNGNTEGVAAVDGAGAVVYLSALTKQINTVTINYAGGTGTVIIKNTNGTSDDTTTEAQTESQTPTQVETSEEATTIEPTIPDGATWVNITGTNGEYQYYIPADYTKYLATVNNESTTIYFGYKEIGAPFKTVKLNGADYTNSGAAYVQIKKAELENGKNYKLEVTSADGNTTVPFYIRKSAVKDYAPTGVAGTVDKSGLASIAWTPSQDAVNAGYTYKVTVDGKDATVTGTTATYQFTEGSYGTYEVVVSTIDGAGNVLASAKTNIEYRAPISFKDDAGQWEKCRYEEIKWTAVDDAVKYAVYVDGKLYQTIEDPTQEMTTVPAYAFANGTNANGQPTTVGTHTSAIVVIKDGDEVKENLSDVSSDNIMGQNKFTLYVNYIYGKGTNLWNKSGTESKWNFTVCEAAHSNITTGADVKVDYNSNGFADLTFNNMGKHSGDDQAWTIKAAIYDEAAKNGETQNMGFNIYGPKELIGQTIRIKCCREEVRDGSYTGPEDIYEEKDYTFVKDKDGNAVIEYSMSFVSTNDSYDLLFGLGNLNFKDATGKTLTLSDADISTVYGITDLKATGTNTETETGDLFVSWSTNIPNRMLGSYTYQVIIDGKVYKDPTYGTEIPGKVQNITAKDYAVGEHTVVVKSIYHSTITSSKEDKAIISKIKKPDLVITDISVPEGTHYIGDTVTVSVTMKNIGNADAVPEAGKNLSVSLFDILSDGTAKQIGNRICHDHEKELINGTETNGYIKAGDTFTAEFPYEIKQLDDNTNFYKLKAVADYDKVVDEGEDEDNNEYTKRFKFYDPLKEVTFTKNNGSIVATWPASNDIKEYIVKYVVNGETKTKTVTANKCDFGDLVAFDEGSTVSVITVGSDDDEHVHAQGKPLSDLIISDVSTPKTMYVEGEVIPITLTMKNVGFTAGTAAGNLTIKPIKGGEFLTTGIEGDPWKIVDSPVAVNDKRTVTFNYTVQKEDVQAGTINIGGMADADNYPNGFMTECDETNNKKEVTISILSGTWTQSLASDNISNPNTLPMYYCGTNPQETNDTCNVENYDGQLYETTGALWYNSKDIKLSSISVYNGNWLSVATSEYVRFANDNADGTKNWKVQIARAQVDPTNNNKFVGKDGKWYDVDPNTAGSHVGIQGTNTIHIGLPWLTENLPIHSDKGGQKDTEFYWIRIVPDTTKGTSDSDNPSQDNINNYKDGSILIPVALHADIPQIQPAQNINAQMSYDDNDNSVFTVSWSELPEQVTYGYTYKIFIGDEEIGGPYTQQQILTFDYNTYQDKLKAANNKVTVKAYWCEQEISTDVEVKAEAKEDWHLISGQSEINIQAGQSKPVQTPGTISFYYNRGDNHVNSVIGYNGDYIAINGNAKYYNAKSKVSVTSGFTTRAQVKAAREAIKNGTADSYNYSDVEKYNYIDGQLQIMAKNLMTANHLTTCYLVKVETTNDDGTSYTSYIMLESVVEAKGNVEIRGFQMNTDATPGAVSEFAPSFRVVSRAGKIAAVQKTGDTEDNPSIEAIVARGTIYALAGGVSNDDMTVTYTPSNDNTKLGEISSNEEKGVHQFTATEEKGIVTNWSGAEGDNDKDNYDYYAVTFKPVEYVVQGLTQEYKVRAYAISENGTVIYDTTEENGYEKPVVPTVSIYKMAEYLYNNSMMPNEAAHDYLYDNVLNIVSITNNYINITKQMLKALGITSKNDENYKYVNAMYRDLYYYVHLAKNYAYKSYMDRGKFTSKTQFDNVDNETILLKILNDKLNPDTPYTSVADWITRNVTENGFYQVKKYERATANTGEQV